MASKAPTILGSRASAFEYTVRRQPWHGFWAPVSGDRQEEIVRAAADLRADDIRLFLGDGGRVLYALPKLPVLDVVELAQVGTHNRQASWEVVRDVLGPIYARCPFDITFADEAGLLAVFHRAPKKADARVWSSAILDAGWIDSYCLMAEESDEQDKDPVAAFLQNGRLRLWWD